jgi:GNAT superfamily N-acetyltransferase
MDQRAALAAYDKQIRNTPRPSISGGRLERDGPVVRCVGLESDNWSGIDWSELDETNADEVIAAQIRHFTELGRSFEWKYYTHDHPTDLPERLRRAGFEPGPEEALMVADIADVPTSLKLPEGLQLVPVTDPEGVWQLVRIHEEVFGGDFSAFGRILLARLTSDLVTGVLAIAGDTAVSASRIDFYPGTEFAGLWGGGTLKAWRGKGIYRAMVAYRARLAAERGARYLQVDALPTSAPILAKLGFVQLGTTVPYEFTP